MIYIVRFIVFSINNTANVFSRMNEILKFVSGVIDIAKFFSGMNHFTRSDVKFVSGMNVIIKFTSGINV